jgi:HK97 family phage major capsid protein
MAYDQLTDRTGADALIPVQQFREILQDMPKSSAALQLFRTVQMSSKTTRQPVLSALPSAYWVSGDTGRKQTTEAAWTNKSMVAEEMAVIVPVPEAVLDDAEYDIIGEVRPLLSEAFGILIDQAVFFGTSKPASWTDPSIVEGAVDAGNSVELGTSAVDFVDDINGVMATVEDDGFDVNGFAARRRIRSQLRGLRDANNGLLFSPSMQAGTPGTLYGEPIAYVSNGAWDDTAAELITGDFTKAIIGIRQDITYKVFTEGVISNDTGGIVLNLMQQDSIALRAVMRVAYAVANPINRLQATEANRFPFGVLTPTVVTP